MAQISVVVPIYRVEKYLRKCVDSILGQSFQDFDLILVDDGSPDACPQICDEYASRDERIVVVHKENGGLSDARNAGIDWAMAHSESQWLAFVDSDDYLHPDYLKVLLETAQKKTADLVICDFVRVNDNEEIIEEEHSFCNDSIEDKAALFETLYSNWRIVPAWNKLYHKSIFSELRFEYGKIHEDEFAIHHVLWNCSKAVIIPNKLYYYRIRGNSIMQTETPKSKLDGMEAQTERCEFCSERGILNGKVGVTLDYIRGISVFKSRFSKSEKQRYKKLKSRLAKIYFADESNRSIKKRVGFYFPKTYAKLAVLFAK